jgi:hypothetical protein
MALDGMFDDGARDARPERHPQHRGSGGDAAAARVGQVEPRTRAECYQALRTADGGSGPTDENQRYEDSRADHRPDPQPERSGWDEVDADNRPALDALRVTPERLTHILDGDPTGGGHRHGTGKPGKTEFPASWDDGKIADTLLDVARRPDRTPRHQEWNDRWVTRGRRDDVEVVVVIARDGRIWGGWPLPGGAGVVKNPEGI